MTNENKIMYPVCSNYKHEELYKDARRRYNTRNCPKLENYSLIADGVVSPHSYVIKASRISMLSSDYLVGIEIEAEGLSDSVAQRAKLADLLDKTLGKGYYYICRDGSLNNSGFEIVTTPLRSCELKYSKFSVLLNEMSEMGFQSHNGGRCGLHISISKSVMSTSNWQMLQRFLNKNKEFFIAISRRGTQSSYAEFKQSYTSKYSALNLSKSDVAEFRFLRGTLLASSFISSVDIIKSLIDYTLLSIKADKKLSACKYKKFLENYKIAYSYALPHLDLLYKSMPKKERIKYTAEEREKRKAEKAEKQKNKARNEILHLLNRSYSINASIDDAGCLNITYYTLCDTVIAHNGALVPVEGSTNSDRILESSVRTLPAKIQQIIQRAEISSVSVIYSARSLGANDKRLTGAAHYAWYYSQGGWGRPAKLYLNLTMRRD